MNSQERWPYLNLLAAHVFYLGDPDDFNEIDRMELDRTEAQVRGWIEDVASGLNQESLKEKINVRQRYRYPEPPDESARQAWHDYVFLFDRSEVLIEEVLSYPHNVLQPSLRIRRFSRRRFYECGEEIRDLFPE